MNGSWGFAATRELTQASVQAAARDAARTARAAAPFQKRPVVLAPAAPVVGTWQTPVERDPLEVPLEEKVSLLLAANEAALTVKGVRFVNSSLSLLREEKTLATTDGTLTAQTFYRVVAGVHGHRDRHRRLPELYARDRAARCGVGIRHRARDGRACRGVGVARRREALGPQRGAGSLRFDHRSHEPVAHNPRDASDTLPSSIARWATRRTMPARASSRRPNGTSATCEYGPRT